MDNFIPLTSTDKYWLIGTGIAVLAVVVVMVWLIVEVVRG